MNDKRIIRRIPYMAAALSFLAAAPAFQSCADWTEPESVKLVKADLETLDPELRAQYLQSLRDYRASEHKVMIAKFDNSNSAPSGRAWHIASLPDSVDYVILTEPDNLHPLTVEEMSSIRSERGTATLYEIDCGRFEAEYRAYEEEWAASRPAAGDGATDTPDGTMKTFPEFLSEKMADVFSPYGRYGYDGVHIVYSGKSPLGMTEAVKAEYLAGQEAFFGKILEWRAANPSALLFFEGTPQYLIFEGSEAFLDGARYIVVPSYGAVSYEEFSYNTLAMDNGSIPSGRFVIGVAAISATDPKDLSGTFNGTGEDGAPMTAIKAAANWVNMEDGAFARAGVLVKRASHDYYNPSMTYSNIRGAISLMNPSPLN